VRFTNQLGGVASQGTKKGITKYVHSLPRGHRGRETQIRIVTKSEWKRGTHFLESMERRTIQDIKRNRASKGYIHSKA
jgi:hypothetical protein